jgi:hypothetical protein
MIAAIAVDSATATHDRAAASFAPLSATGVGETPPMV